MIKRVRLGQIYYNSETEALVSKSCFPISNYFATPFLENEVIALIGKTKRAYFVESDYFGIFSARFEDKNFWKSSVNSLSEAISLIKKDAEDVDVYSFFKEHTQRNVWTVADRWQSGILEIATLIFKEFEEKTNIKIGNVAELDTPIIYQNAFVAKTDIYLKYINEFLIPLMKIMSNKANEPLQTLLYNDAKYRAVYRIKNEDCIKVFGRDYYTFFPFVCERFFPTYCALKKLTIKHI